MYKISFLLLTLITTTFASVDTEKLSVALGHMIGKNLYSLDLSLDLEAVVKGLKDEAAGLNSPMTEEICLESLMLLQRKKSLELAETFLAQNKTRENIVSLLENKLQYEILQKGTGETVQTYNSPLIRLRLEGESQNLKEKDEILPLAEASLGVKKGIAGMKEGEIRKLYIHPELQSHACHSFSESPGDLLILEVEVIKADAAAEAHAASNVESPPIFLSLDDVRPFIR